MEAVATAGVEVVVQNLINFLKEEYSLLRGLEEDAGKLQETLEMIQAYLSDAEKKSTTEAVKIWLRKLEAVAFDADNVLDELNYHFLYKKVRKMDAPNPKLKNKVLSCLSSCSGSGISRRSKMAHTIKQINVNFESVNKMATDLGLQNMLVNAPPMAVDTCDETDSLSLDPIFIGRDDDVPKLVDLLTQTHQEERMFSIVALVGMGGMGKTTLTKKVINHERVKFRFGSLFWVHVSQTFDPIILSKKILSTLTSDGGDEGQSREAIMRKLQEALKDKTYLLVLDDVWNEDVPKWEDFINSMSGVTSTTGNGIIITTRNQNVASTVKPFHIYSLNGLSDVDCWSIIKEKAFDGNEEVPPQFEIIGKKIAEACRGLPLAANVVGGVLRRCKSEEEWHSISDNCLSDAEGAERINKILKLSFDYLPSPSLKKCFAYCSVFPKGHQIEKQEVIEQWMAEGFLRPDERNEMEDVGNKFFNVLLHNSLMQVAQRDEYGNVERCVMHDLVHDLASSTLSNNAEGITPTRYIFRSHISKEVAKQLRTLILKSGTSGILFSDFQSLHNLTLDDDNITELPNSIRELIHLRYLDISNTSTKDLPEWIGELSHMQTLRLSRVSSSQKLANTLKYLVNLRHLYIKYDIELPAEIGRLTSLQTLPYFKVGEEKGYHIEELGSLKNLKGNLIIKNLERVLDKEEALKANIFQKQHLSELWFEWGSDCSGERDDDSVLEGLSAPANLKKLEIYYYKGKRFPTWLEGEPQGSCLPLHNLIELKLVSCSECEEITLDHLPNLRSLYISELKSLKCLSKRFFYNHRNLSDLRIYECDMLEALPDGLDTLNSLEDLTIGRCRNLKSMGNPSCGEGENQGTLRWLRIRDCGELMELPRQMLELWAPTIEELELDGLRSLTNLPMLIDCLAKSSHLKRLTIRGVPKLKSAGSVESWDLGSLRHLVIDVSVEWSEEISVGINETVNGILKGCCNSLESLTLRGVENWEWLPQPIQLLTSLWKLELENIGIEELPQWFGNLSALTQLHLDGCTKLRCLKLLAKLKELVIGDCPSLSIDSERRNNPNLKIYTIDPISKYILPLSH